ncbi:MAG TPA: hypothetical protein VN540_10055 [Clostridia bacterium]|nr:hypothetical protein [Clostridia bacterium]
MLREHILGFRSVSIIGMCKNAGKTTVLNRIIRELRDERLTLALTSIGRDGEAVDVVTGTAKPGIYIHENTLVATAEGMLRECDVTREIVGATGYSTPLGEVVLFRARSDGSVQLAGPSMTAQLIALTDTFASLGADMTVIDGALSRKSLCAPAVSEATVLCAGASYSKSIDTLVEDTAFAAKLLTLPRQTLWSEAEIADERASKVRMKRKDGSVAPLPEDMPLADALRCTEYADIAGVFISGAVTDALLRPVLQGGANIAGVEFASLDGSKLLFRRDAYDKLALRGARLAVARPVRLAAITVNPVSAYGWDMNPAELLGRMRAAVDVPVMDVMNEEGGTDA